MVYRFAIMRAFSWSLAAQLNQTAQPGPGGRMCVCVCDLGIGRRSRRNPTRARSREPLKVPAPEPASAPASFSVEQRRGVAQDCGEGGGHAREADARGKRGVRVYDGDGARAGAQRKPPANLPARPTPPVDSVDFVCACNAGTQLLPIGRSGKRNDYFFLVRVWQFCTDTKAVFRVAEQSRDPDLEAFVCFPLCVNPPEVDESSLGAETEL